MLGRPSPQVQTVDESVVDLDLVELFIFNSNEALEKESNRKQPKQELRGIQVINFPDLWGLVRLTSQSSFKIFYSMRKSIENKIYF